MHRTQQPPSYSPLETDDPDELRLVDLWRMIVARPWWVLGPPLLLALAAIGFVLLAMPQWESTAVIQIGQVGQMGVGERPALIESPARTIERLRLMQDEVLMQLGLPLEDGNIETRLFRDSMKMRQIPNTDLIELKLRAVSRQAADDYAKALVSHVGSVHQQLAKPSVDLLHAALADAQEDLRRRTEERDALNSSINTGAAIKAGDRFAESVLLSNLRSQVTEGIRDAKLRIRRLEEQLSPLRTYPTSLTDAIRVPRDPVYPRRALTMVLAVLGGLGAGIVVALVIGVYEPDRRRTEPAE